MKISDDNEIGRFISFEESANRIDMEVREMRIYCPNCHQAVHVMEGSISTFSERILRDHLKMIDELANDMISAAVDIYGSNPLNLLWTLKCKQMKEEMLKPKLTIVKEEE